MQPGHQQGSLEDLTELTKRANKLLEAPGSLNEISCIIEDNLIQIKDFGSTINTKDLIKSLEQLGISTETRTFYCG